MAEDDLMAALERLLEPTETDDASERPVVPYWLMPAAGRSDTVAHPELMDLAPDLESFLSDGFSAEARLSDPSLAEMAAYVDGTLAGAERDAFEAALVASPELRAEIEMLSDRVALFEADLERPVVDLQGEPGQGSPRSST